MFHAKLYFSLILITRVRVPVSLVETKMKGTSYLIPQFLDCKIDSPVSD